ncbi:MAG: hypothetical protein H7124_01860 [Phycisphaerales bacterium]|nr:hypothetical protein [Hyphomonadaceae bacterium]
MAEHNETGREEGSLRTPDKRPLVHGEVRPEAAERTPEAQDGLADEIGIEIDNAIERPQD